MQAVMQADNRDSRWMQRALEKVPVGAVLVCDDELLGEGFNLSVYIPTGRVGEAFGVDPQR